MRADLIDDVPVPDGGARRARESGTRRARARRRVLVAGGGVVAALALVLTITTRVDRDPDVRTAGPASTAGGTNPAVAAPMTTAPPLLDIPAPARDAQAKVPEGWRVVTYGLAQLAIPPDWIVQPPETPRQSCPPGGALYLGAEATSLTGLAGCPGPAIVLNRSTGTCTVCGDSIQVNGLSLQSAAESCAGCAMTAYVEPLQLRLDEVTRGDSATMLAVYESLTLSPVARVFADGPTLDTTFWPQFSEAGVTLRVPPAWPSQRVDPRDPMCADPPFTTDPVVLLGPRSMTDQCKAIRRTPAPADGVWIGADPVFPDLRGPITVDGVPARWERPTLSTVVVLALPANGTDVFIEVGIGPDPAVARTILRTITLAP